MFRILFMILVSFLSMMPKSQADECNCNCIFDHRNSEITSICQSIKNLWKESYATTEKLKAWEKFRPLIEVLVKDWSKDFSDFLEKKVKNEKWEQTTKNRNEKDSQNIPNPSKDNSVIVSNLLIKVESLENRMIEVEENLKQEQHIRRHLEQETKEIRISLTNATLQLDDKMDEVQLALNSSIHSINKTVYEDHLKLLDEVAYRDETKNLNERIKNIEREMYITNNVSILFKFQEEQDIMKENFYQLNNSVESTFIFHVEQLNDTIQNYLVPRIKTLETGAFGKEEMSILMQNISNWMQEADQSLMTSLNNLQSDVKSFKTNCEQNQQAYHQEIKIIQSSMLTLHDRINSTAEFDAILNRMQNILNSSLEDMNKTIHEDHLKMHDKMNNMASETEIITLTERQEQIESETRNNIVNITSRILMLEKKQKIINESLYHTSNFVERNGISIKDMLNSIDNIVVPKLGILEIETVSKNTLTQTEDSLKNLINNVEQEFRNDLVNAQLEFKAMQTISEQNQRINENEMKKIQSSLITLSARVNATEAVDVIMARVTTLINTALEGMNKTLHKDHLKIMDEKTNRLANKNEIQWRNYSFQLFR